MSDDTLPDPPEDDEDVVEEVAEEASPAEEPAPEATEQPEAAPDIWSHFRSMPEFEGQQDEAIANHLYAALQQQGEAARALQQYQTVMPIAQEYLQNRQQYEEWLATRNQPQAPQAAPQPQQTEPKSWWTPPEIKESYKKYLTRDENGREVISPDAPLEAKAALQDYQEFRADFAQKFLDNPEQALGPMIEKFASERAESMIESRIERMRDEEYVQRLESENKDWLFDENGNASAEGVAVQKYIQDARAKGINGVQARWEYAEKMVERDLAVSALQMLQQQQQQQPQLPPQQQQQQPAPAESQAQRNMEFLRNQALRTANRRSASASTERAPEKSMTFEERLTAAAQNAGLL